MKYYVITFLTLFMLSCSSNVKRKPMGNSKFQKNLNTSFKDASTSPLTKSGLKKFKGLEFFPIQEKYKVTAKFTKISSGNVLEIPTTSGGFDSYREYGEIKFVLEGKDLSLVIYKIDIVSNLEYKDHLFLPFLDKTNGKTSYSGGRFIEILTTDENNGIIEIDFNKAYNPYCAYSNKYSCPITPRDNYLDVEINAGVMKYKNH